MCHCCCHRVLLVALLHFLSSEPGAPSIALLHRMSAKRILILDDEPNICRSLQMILEHAGYAVTISRTIEEGRLLASRADAKLPSRPFL